ncbi:hypothetical protein Tco_1203837 [Tanacetum coccineum]
MYENFNAPSTESLDSIFIRLQKIVSQLAILGENISQEDLNLMLLRSLPSEWNTHVVVWRNKLDLDSMSFDDISTNEVNTANVQVSTANSSVSTTSTHDKTTNLCDATVYAFLANQPNGSQLVHEDLEQIPENGLEEMDLEGSRNQACRARNQDSSRRTVNMEETASKAMVAIDGAGFDWSYMADEEVPTNMTLMAFSDSEENIVKTCSNTCLKSFEALKTQLDNLRVEFNKSEFNLATYKRGLASVEEQLVFYKKNEANKSVCENSSNEIKKTTDALIIEDWVSDCDEDDSKVMVLKSDNVQHKPEQANQPKKMANMDFCNKHNMVAFLQKPTGSEKFHQIVDFLIGSHIRYALTANPTICVSLIEQFWQTVTVDTVNDGEKRLTVTVDGKTIAITKASIRRHLQLADADGISSLPNTEIFDQLTLMGYVSNDDKLTFQKGVHIPLFDTMLIHDQPGQGKGPTLTVESQHTPIASPPTLQPTTSQPMSSQEQPSQVPLTEPITDSFTTSHLTQTPSPMPRDSPLSGGHTPGSDEGSKKLNELTELCTKLSDKVTSLEDDLKQTKKIYGKALTKLVKKVKHLEAKLKSTTERRKARMVISDDEEIYAAKILVDASREKVKTYTRRRVLTVQEIVLLEVFLVLLRKFKLDEREETDNIDWNTIAEQVQERQLDTIKKKDTEVKKTKTKRIDEETLLQESFKKLRTTEASRSEPIQEQPKEEPKELSEEEFKKMIEIVPIIRVRNITKAYQVFEDMLKGFDKEDLVTLWSLVKERFRSAEPTKDNERALWVELKRLFEPDKDDVL